MKSKYLRILVLLTCTFCIVPYHHVDITMTIKKNAILKEYQLMDKSFLSKNEKKTFDKLGYSFILRYDLNRDNYKEYFVALRKKDKVAIVIIDPRQRKKKILQIFYFNYNEIYIYKPRKFDKIKSIAIAFNFSTELEFDILYKKNQYLIVPIELNY